eukprot:9242407-Ditylum_brightwellii.AAC.1
MKGDPIYIHLSPKMRGFAKDHVLKLSKSIYVQVDDPRCGMKSSYMVLKRGSLWLNKDIDGALQLFRDDRDKYNCEKKEGISLVEFLGAKIDPDGDEKHIVDFTKTTLELLCDE